MENEKPKHTPGPWESTVPPSSLGACRWIRGSTGATVALIGYRDYSDGQAADLANAALIARAPEMQAEIDRLRAVNAELVAALSACANLMPMRSKNPVLRRIRAEAFAAREKARR